MSVVTIQVGQCGNQLGASLLDALYDGSVATNGPRNSATAPIGEQITLRRRREKFFQANKALDEEEEIRYLEASSKPSVENERRRGKTTSSAPTQRRIARAIMVDMEPRVIEECLATRRRWRYEAASCLSFEGGSGNNWAQGFVQHGPKQADALIELARRQAEACDFMEAFTIIQSAGGGTGSGLGTYLTGELGDHFPNTAKINVLVWPHQSGEIVVQNYNAILTTNHLQSFSDGVVCLFNDHARYVCLKQQHNKQPELDDLNRVLAGDLASSMLLPALPSGSKPPCPRWASPLCSSVSDTVRFMCPQNAFKMLQTHTVPMVGAQSISFTTNSWTSLLKDIKEAPTGMPMGHRVPFSGRLPYVKRLLTFRGLTASEYRVPQSVAFKQVQELFGPGHPCRTTTAEVLRMYTEDRSKTVLGVERSISLLSNSSAIVAPLEAVTVAGHRMFSTGAFVHQYAAHGLSRDEIHNSFVGAEQIIHDYSSLSNQ